MIAAVFAIRVRIFTNKDIKVSGGTSSNQEDAARFSQAPQAGLLNAIKREFTIAGPEKDHFIKPKTLNSWLEEYYRPYTGRREFRPNGEKIESFLIALARNINQPPANARLNVDENGNIEEVSPSRPGQQVNIPKTASNISAALMRGRNSTQLELSETPPQITLASAKQLGITTLLGRGESNFTGSPNSRTHNIKIGAGTFNGIILKPGEEFSFNKILGPVEASTGYQPELVIKNKTLVPEYGGGLCQVSTTLFRAAFVAGLPILERHPHSLPVRYYNPQGFDATIYPGVSDFRFNNNTAGPILIQAVTTAVSISFEIYGSSDGRKVITDGPHIYDSQPDGSLKTWLKRIITYRNGSEKKDVFYSNYKSPSLFPTVRNPLE